MRAGGLESISCIQNQANLRMLKEQWVVEHKPEVYWNMLQTAETVAKRYGISRQAQDEYGVQSQLRAAAAAQGRPLRRRDRAVRDDHGGGRQRGGHHRHEAKSP